jgi:hypothetical protein
VLCAQTNSSSMSMGEEEAARMLTSISKVNNSSSYSNSRRQRSAAARMNTGSDEDEDEYSCSDSDNDHQQQRDSNSSNTDHNGSSSGAYGSSSMHSAAHDSGGLTGLSRRLRAHMTMLDEHQMMLDTSHAAGGGGANGSSSSSGMDVRLPGNCAPVTPKFFEFG